MWSPTHGENQPLAPRKPPNSWGSLQTLPLSSVGKQEALAVALAIWLGWQNASVAEAPGDLAGLVIGLVSLVAEQVAASAQ